MLYSSMEGLKDLKEEDAQKVYKEAVKVLKKDDPLVFLKILLFAGAGGAAGVIVGVVLKDMVLQIQGLNIKSLLVLVACAALGGGIGGFIGSKKLNAMLRPCIDQVRQDLGY
jgi:hypothetical protein